VVAGLFLATVSVWSPVVRGHATPTLDVIFFDVGQGDAVLLKTPRDRHMLVDTGSRSPSSAAVEFAVLPFLERWGIQTLDLVAVTHSDEDHLGGLPTLLNEVSVRRVVRNGKPADTELYAEALQQLRRRSVPREAVHRGDTIRTGSSLRVNVLGPPPRRKFDDENNMSLVLKVGYGAVDVLLPGDVEAAAERNLVRTYRGQLESHVVKIPHHGSATSSTSEFVRAASAPGKTYAVVSVGQNDQYDMPSETVLRRWRQSGANVHSTARGGAVWIRTDGKDVWRVRWK
jgi:competence protein ComEC